MEQLSLFKKKKREMTSRDSCATCKYHKYSCTHERPSEECLVYTGEIKERRGWLNYYYNFFWEPREADK